jgi:non-ribosomal peptide synthetase-like protein
MSKSTDVVALDRGEPPGGQDSGTGLAPLLATVFADVSGAARVPADANFFDDLGADSMVMARFCARVRKRPDLPDISIKDVYRNPTLGALAGSLNEALGRIGPAQVPAPPPAQAPTAPAEAVRRAGTAEYLLCGVLQALSFLAYAYVAGLATASGYDWISTGVGFTDVYLRTAACGAIGFAAMCVLPIAAKWLLIGRWKPARIRIWSLTYFRFWLVKTLVRWNPLARFFLGTPLYSWYLRALGAKIGRGVVVFSRYMPVCTDLLTIGDGTILRKDVFVSCYQARAGEIHTGRVTLGRDVFVGEWTVLDIDTSMGDGAQLGHASALLPGQAVPAREHWHGSPAEPTSTDYRTVEGLARRPARAFAYNVSQLLSLLLVYLPLLLGGMDLLFDRLPSWLDQPLAPGLAVFTSGGLYLEALVGSGVVLFGGALLGVVLVVTLPRLLNLAVRPDRTYPLYGARFSAQRMVAVLTNIKFFKNVLGDSSGIAHYLRWLGYRLTPLVQTGSNFAPRTKHENPYLITVGTGTVVADELSVVNADFSSTSFRVSRATIGAHNYLGNFVTFPSQARTGDNCLLATKVMVPIDGPVRQGVGLLGSPCFEIPRTVDRDAEFRRLASGDELRRRLPAKNRHNAVTALLYLLERWFYYFVLFLIGLSDVGLYSVFGALEIAVGTVLLLMFNVGYPIVVERAYTAVWPLRPLYCSIYERDFWRHERFWKLSLSSGLYGRLLNGTPFKSLLWRALGIRLGRRLFDDGCDIPEKTLLTIGDDVTLNLSSHVQCHSQEDFAFKADHIEIGSGCTLGVGAFVHYGVTIGDGAELAADSFLMKGEDVPPHARWRGNPASQTQAESRRCPAWRQ